MIKLFFLNIFLISSKIYLPLLSSKADSPIITSGFLAETSFFEKSISLLIIFLMSSVLLPIIVYSYVRSPGSPME